MSFLEELMAAVFPAVLIELWSGADGWPCYKINLCVGPDDEPFGDGVEYPTFRAAWDAAEEFGASMLPGRFHVINITMEAFGA
ncbi:hypothetical protein [Novosphingobium sp. KN65.2]|uniref:hypothetical protein n=1 Tax=Novosphingobium sp. KN65.2 TaxID=1478134 RepID=UPI0005E0CDC3|nr:hypothetical protein [Novosphingobium sp. KN65.2]CDO38306.1 hypothetical protein SPHV1_550023 [Novosphingobium sp. KN65.2]